MWDLIVSVPDHCLSFYLPYMTHIVPLCIFDSSKPWLLWVFCCIVL